MTETQYLMQGENGKRLAESIAQVKAGDTTERELMRPSNDGKVSTC